jgi:predicted phage-related endonuclease
MTTEEEEQFARTYLELSEKIRQLEKRKAEISAAFKMEVEGEERAGNYLIVNKEVQTERVDMKSLAEQVDLSPFKFFDYHLRLTVKAVG